MYVCFQMVNGNDLLISNLHAWSIRQLGWTEPTRPSPDKRSIFPTEGNNTFPESEETPGKIIPLLSSQNTWRGCTVFLYSLSQCKRHIQDKRSVLSALRGSAQGEKKSSGTETLLKENTVIKDPTQVKGQVLPKFPRNGGQTNWINTTGALAGMWEDCGRGVQRKRDTRE